MGQYLALFVNGQTRVLYKERFVGQRVDQLVNNVLVITALYQPKKRPSQPIATAFRLSRPRRVQASTRSQHLLLYTVAVVSGSEARYIASVAGFSLHLPLQASFSMLSALQRQALGLTKRKSY